MPKEKLGLVEFIVDSTGLAQAVAHQHQLHYRNVYAVNSYT